MTRKLFTKPLRIFKKSLNRRRTMDDESALQDGEEAVEVNLYEEVELHTNCTVQIL